MAICIEHASGSGQWSRQYCAFRIPTQRTYGNWAQLGKVNPAIGNFRPSNGFQVVDLISAVLAMGISWDIGHEEAESLGEA